jgi:site-specific recombinase XerD
MQSNKTCLLVEQYLDYLLIIKNRSGNTILEYRTDLLMFFSYIMKLHNINIVDINFDLVNL